MKNISIVVAFGLPNRVIGNSKINDLPGWVLRTDMFLFKKLTEWGVVIMGRKTCESIPDQYFPLENRVNIIVSRDPNYKRKNADESTYHVCTSLEAAIELAEKLAPERRIFLIGGGELYKYALETLAIFIEEIIATEVVGVFEGDVFFPELSLNWSCIVGKQYEAIENKNSHAFMVNKYHPESSI